MILTAPLALGINGIKISHGYLYFDNIFAKTLYRIRLDSSYSPAKEAKAELVVYIPEAVGIDDFAIGENGTIWVDDNAGNRVFVVRRDGSYVVAVGAVTELTVAGATAAAFGRDRGDGEVLYVTTTGALAAPVNGTHIQGGKVVAVDTRGFF